MRWRNPLGGLAIMLLLGACAVNAPPIQHFQLSDGSPPAATTDSPVIMLETIRLPDFLLREELLLRDGEYSLRYDPTRRWAEPVDLGVQRVIANRLESRLNTRRVSRFPQVPHGTTVDWRLTVTVEHLERDGSNALISAEGRWARASDDETVAVVTFSETSALSGIDGNEIAAALSELLWRFADALADALPRDSVAQLSPDQG